MKIMIAYPPLESEKGVPLLGQNRQFQWFNNPTYIYPVVPAQAATLLEQNGYEVVWSDGIAEDWTYEQFLEHVNQEKPDLIAMETKTPVVKQHWKIISDLKNPSIVHRPSSIILFGDHVTALPQESMENSPVDYILTGGNYDFLLLNLCNCLVGQGAGREKQRAGSREQGAVGRSPTLKNQSTELEPGIWYRDDGQIKNTGPFNLDHDLSDLPFIDRDLTKWHLYSEKNGNYKFLPGTYIMSARDCWWGKCAFCSWTTIYPKYKMRSVENVLDEIGNLIDKYEIKEIMDDSGSFPTGKWLQEFCDGMIERRYNRKVVLDGNMRFGALSLEEYKLMKEAGFRLLLFGLESGNQDTLDRIDKGLTLEEIEESCKLASKAGFDPHITVMFGYPWETRDDIKRTVDFASHLMRKGYASTLQATIVIPYPGTPLFEECKQKEWLKTLDWERYDMREPVMKTPVGDKKLKEAVQSLYKVAFHPEFIARKIINVRSLEDVRFLGRAALKVGGHILDFKNHPDQNCQQEH